MQRDLDFRRKLKVVKAKGVIVRKDRGQWLWFCPKECWFGYFDTAQEAFKEAFGWYGLEPLTNAKLLAWKQYRQEQESCQQVAA